MTIKANKRIRRFVMGLCKDCDHYYYPRNGHRCHGKLNPWATV